MSWETFEDRRESRKSRLYWIIFSFFSALGEDSTIFEVWRPFEGLEREIETEVTIRPLLLTATVAVVEIGCFFVTNTPGTNSWTLGFHFSVNLQNSDSEAEDRARTLSFLLVFGELLQSEWRSESRSDPDDRPEPDNSIPDSSVIPGAAWPGFSIGNCGSATGP